VSGRDSLHLAFRDHTLEESLSFATAELFQISGHDSHIVVDEWQSQGGGHLFHEGCIPIRFGAPEAMVDVQNGQWDPASPHQYVEQKY
jgi:hypothetical protein